MGMGWWGTHFGRTQTWAEPGKAYYRYLARAQSLLQRGQGIGVYLTLDFAVANADAIPRAALLRGDVRVDQGQIVLPSGRRYPFLTLPKSETMLPEVARKLKEIVSKGAVIVGQKPVRSPGLSGFPGCDDEVQKIASELWGETDGRNKIENNVGKGKVFTQNANLLNKCKIVPAVTFVEQGPRKARATARQDGETAIFFISNTSDSFYEATPSFHVVGKQPEIWQAEDGSYSDAPLWREVSGRTEVPLRLRGKESVFVIFRKPAPRGDHLVALQADTGAKTWNVEVNSKGVPVIAASSALSGVALWSSGNIVHFLLSPPLPVIISGAWDVSFAPGMGAPDKIVFPDLKSWSENSVPAIKYFSGTATYRKTIDIPAEFSSKSKRVILDLGAVSNLAAVKVNGIDFGVSWYAPFQLDISAALKPGQNKLEIIVTNTWANRMIGDEQEPEDMEWGPKRTHFSDFTGRSLLAFPDWFVKGQPRPSQGRKTFTTWNYFKKDSPLLPAGLLGPVTLRAMDEIGVLNCNLLQAQDFESKPADPFFAHVAPVKAPVATGLYLKTGDRLAICGDSITAQKIYSKFIETYLTVCVPELKITVRQFGRNGETTTGFLKNMTNDCLRFKPTIATTCYGMNDYGYNPYSDSRGKSYRDNYTAVAKVFKGIGARVVLGSPGCVGKVASWVKSATGTLDEHNQSLCKFRNIAIEIAKQEEIRFADVFWPMFTAGFTAKQKYSPEYEIAGKDGVHPGWAGHLVMAYSFLKAMGLDGEIGTFTVDLKAGQAAATAGHRMDDFKNGVITVTSSRYPFCASGDPKQDNSIRSGMMLVPFNQDLNRLLLVVTNGVAAKYKVTWGTESRSYSASELAAGVNLAADFAVNPFSKAFAKVDAAVLLNQEYKTKQVQAILRGAEGKADMEAAVKRTEAERAPLAAAIANAFVPVTHTIRIEAE
jgi:lysophospholipase L1-like esterase